MSHVNAYLGSYSKGRDNQNRIKYIPIKKHKHYAAETHDSAEAPTSY